MRRHLLAYVPPALLLLVAVAQFAVAKTTTLSAWKLGGFGMFSTSNSSSFRVLRVTLDGDGGRYVIPDDPGEVSVLTWPRAAALRELAREAVCGSWRLVPLDSVETVLFPSEEWEPFYRSPPAQAQTDLAGFAVPAGPGEGAAVRSARASVVWIRLDTSGEPSRLVPEPVAAETVTPRAAGCPAVR